MSLTLHVYDDTTITKMGRWTFLTFLQYIHNQIAHLLKDISQKNEHVSAICQRDGNITINYPEEHKYNLNVTN